LDFSKPADKARHARMVELVEQMLAARKQLAGALAKERPALLRRPAFGSRGRSTHHRYAHGCELLTV